MWLPRNAFWTACLPVLLMPSVSAAPMGASSRATVQIVASVAPRVQITGSTQIDGTTTSALCIESNAPDGFYSVTAVDGSGVALGTVATIPASSLCQSGIPSDSTLLKVAASSDSPATLLIAPE